MPAPETATDLQIGDVAERTGLSLKTIRHYEEVGLLPESRRSPGGFRLYGEPAVRRLLLIMQMKPLGFSLEEMADIIALRERLASPRLSERTRAGVVEQLAAYQALADEKLADLRRRVDSAERFARELQQPLA
ncbi:MerR family DNA-binding transcriptional regulator [Phycicoccus sp. MAQZ13P-2]|uniref:MerR family DNA-binding transcriptional regulator n=1 Tax=Phycicoccus mangrovi TaxID=2840470 RepID=UPI001C0035CC|nr:MerR family DNA-binding transcriptional regulator [Phycicoccus mangrovi]MBT9255637.1 MerR family DNA-binding transcriptional regulator [Phycicoccus mangrovi]MBT9275351.1 MerR family DNA-binding transcriptional regulator [Phycicoccus mangrovi]